MPVGRFLYNVTVGLIFQPLEGAIESQLIILINWRLLVYMYILYFKTHLQEVKGAYDLVFIAPST